MIGLESPSSAPRSGKTRRFCISRRISAWLVLTPHAGYLPGSFWLVLMPGRLARLTVFGRLAVYGPPYCGRLAMRSPTTSRVPVRTRDGPGVRPSLYRHGSIDLAASSMIRATCRPSSSRSPPSDEATAQICRLRSGSVTKLSARRFMSWRNISRSRRYSKSRSVSASAQSQSHVARGCESRRLGRCNVRRRIHQRG